MKNKQVTMTKKLINLLLKREREKNENIARTSESAKGLLFRASESVKSTHLNESDIIYRDFAPTPTAILDAMFHSNHTSAVPTHTRTTPMTHINESTPTPCVRQCFARITPQLFCHLFVSATHTHTQSIFNRNSASGREIDRHPSPIPSCVKKPHKHTNVRSILPMGGVGGSKKEGAPATIEIPVTPTHTHQQHLE